MILRIASAHLLQEIEIRINTQKKIRRGVGGGVGGPPFCKSVYGGPEGLRGHSPSPPLDSCVDIAGKDGSLKL
jgi:hypothetical protein